MMVSDEREGIGRSSGARNDIVREAMEHTIKIGECPFCPVSFEANRTKAAVIDLDGTQYWNVWHNPSPLRGTSLHIMVASKTHVKEFEELPDKAILEYHWIISMLKQMFKFSSYSTLSRQGGTDFNSATVEHLHAHLIVSNPVPAGLDLLPSKFHPLLKSAYGALKQVTPQGVDPLEWVNLVCEALDVQRAMELGKAYPVRAKLSNKAVQPSSE